MKYFLTFFWMLMVSVEASPQTSRADLRAAQVPALTVTNPSGVTDFKGVTLRPGVTYMLGALTGVGAIDLTDVTRVGGGGNLTITPASNVVSGITSVVGGDGVQMTDDFSDVYYLIGEDATLTYSGFSSDPGINVTTVLSGGTGSVFGMPGAGGTAKLDLQGNTWPSLTIGVDLKIGADNGELASAGGSLVYIGNNASLVTLTITELSLSAGNTTNFTTFDASNCTALTTVNVPGSIGFTFNPNNVGFGGGAILTFNGDAISPACVQAILDALVAGVNTTNGFSAFVDLGGAFNGRPTDGGTDETILSSFGYSISSN